jgi:hypothetical protein
VLAQARRPDDDEAGHYQHVSLSAFKSSLIVVDYRSAVGKTAGQVRGELKPALGQAKPKAGPKVLFRDHGQAEPMTMTGYDDPLPGAERHRAVHRALAEARNLARLQIELLTRLDQADQAGDDEAVLRCHTELDHVMTLIAETEQVRTGARASLASTGDLTCAGCGEAAEPVYERPRLLGYRCASCGWSGDDPDARAARKHAEALASAAAAVAPAIEVLGDAITTLGQRGKRARTDGLAALRDLQQSLTAADQRLRRTRPA